MSLTRRTQAKKPEPIPPREAEPETTLCKEPEMAPMKRTVERCSESCIFEAYKKGLCFNHWKESEGFTYDEKQNRFIKSKEKK